MRDSSFLSKWASLSALFTVASGFIGVAPMAVQAEPASQSEASLVNDDVLSMAQVDAYQAPGRWLGPGWWANRLHDWRRSDQGDMWCAPAQPFLAWRVAHDMVRPLDRDAQRFDFQVKVSLETEDSAKPLAKHSLAGFLLGVGHNLPDPLARAMVFDFRRAKNATGPYPAVVGSGIAAGVSGSGQLRLVDLDHGRVLAEIQVKLTPGMPLRLSGVRDGDAFQVSLQATSTDGPVEIRTKIPAARFHGGIGLLSHPGQRSKQHSSLVTRFSGYQALAGTQPTPKAAIGPVVAAQYTVHRGVLKLSAQCMPQDKGTLATLSLMRGGKWQDVSTAKLHEVDQLALFRVEKWDSSKAVPYRVSLALAGSEKKATYSGTVAAEPEDGQVRLAVLGCIIHRPWGAVRDWSESLYFPHHDLQKRVAAKKPDLVFFYGDQMYETTPSPVDRSNYFEDYLYKWLFHCQAFKEMVRHVPSVTIPDDHDVFQGNYWGEGGRKAPDNDWNNGGYLHPGAFVAQVHRTQTSHLPDAVEPDCLEQGIPAYHCGWNWGGVSFAILGDRYFKSGPAGHGLPKSGTNRPDHYNNPKFDTKDLDLPGLQLLGEPQERFLAQWAADWSDGAQMKAVLSQSPFGNCATHHAGTYLIADLDSNGWPQSGRNRALELLRSARSVHIAGDQHLSTMVQHGIENHGDAVYGFTAPAVSNAYARAYYPALKSNYYQSAPPKPDQYLGERLDGFKNKVTFLAVANPDTRSEGPYHTDKRAALNYQVPGFGIVDFDTRQQTSTFYSHPRSEVVAARLKGGTYPGWPVTVRAADNDGRKPVGELLRVTGVDGIERPVVRVYGPDGRLQWARRMTSGAFTVPAYARGEHRIEVGDGNLRWTEFSAQPGPKGKEVRVKKP